MGPVIKHLLWKQEHQETQYIIELRNIIKGGSNMEAPSEFKEFYNLMQRLTPRYGAAIVFDDFLDYVIASFSIDQSVTWEKSYNKSEMQVFWLMYLEFIKVMDQKCITNQDWFDFPGLYYEAEISSKSGRQGAGQFFTPPSICDLMTATNTATKKKGLLVNDPSCGSGRCLMSFHVQNLGNYYVAQDIDRTCAKMTICNFLVHGLQADVIWGNTLTMEYFDAWKVNEVLHVNSGVPHVRRFNSQELEELKNSTGIIKEETKPVTLMDFVAAGVAK
jgi:type I restriction enzyme M protein